eukprot:CAMPEP_0196737368 /NCGR_PEP_ID=MMETSP1091-20130531/15128_1 /TAXON_ID=302021 /ORGANISM="Rhodomonas sp., Strain CCMP768" /LENGTH=134 /DNA_ID=CAMNT_0042081211 /DNA_START=192 /DNA_END=593 /DNA_ORIENTATION=-
MLFAKRFWSPVICFPSSSQDQFTLAFFAQVFNANAVSSSIKQWEQASFSPGGSVGHMILPSSGLEAKYDDSALAKATFVGRPDVDGDDSDCHGTQAQALSTTRNVTPWIKSSFMALNDCLRKVGWLSTPVTVMT